MSERIQAAEAAIAEANENGALAGKYLTFKLAQEEFGVEILKVREIIGLMGITVVPRTPTAVRGVINLRGKIIPVVDLRVKFDMDTVQDTELTCIIVVDVTHADQVAQMGILVDTVCEVLDIDASHIEPTPTFGSSCNTDFILGMARVEDEVKVLLDIHRVLGEDEIQSIVQATDSADKTKTQTAVGADAATHATQATPAASN